ncbi:MAG: transposase [Streptomyces sp.]|nr:transposase [Streptomyces sp.]
MPFKRKHSEAMWLKAVELFAAGHREWAVGSELGLSRSTMRRWLWTYERYGVVGWAAVSTPQKYSFETKLAAVQAFLGGTTKSEVMAEFEIRNQTQMDNWIALYRKGGEDALRPRPRGRQPAGNAEETPERKIQRLEMENAALKKLRALAAEERRPGTKSPSSPR